MDTCVFPGTPEVARLATSDVPRHTAGLGLPVWSVDLVIQLRGRWSS